MFFICSPVLSRRNLITSALKLQLTFCVCVVWCWCVCRRPAEEKPAVTNVTVSDVSWESFLLSWSADDGAHDAFLIEVTDAETGAEWQNHTVPADARSLVVSGLSPGTWYKAALYGVHTGVRLEPVFADTITGTDAVSSGASLCPLLHSLPAALRKRTATFSCCLSKWHCKNTQSYYVFSFCFVSSVLRHLQFEL